MCASLLRQFGIRKVYFGAANDRFGGTGGVLSIHDCGAVDPAYEVSGGWLREEAIMMLRRFYVQENGKGEFPLDLFGRGFPKTSSLTDYSTGAEAEEGESLEP